MKKVRTGILLVLFGVLTLALSLTPVLPYLLGISSGGSGREDVPTTAQSQPAGDRFAEREFIPGVDTGRRNFNGDPNPEAENTAFFSLRSEFFRRPSVSNDVPVPNTRPVFSNADMTQIMGRSPMTAIPGGGTAYNTANDRAAFVMLDNANPQFFNRVVLEFGDITDIRGNPNQPIASFNGELFHSSTFDSGLSGDAVRVGQFNSVGEGDFVGGKLRGHANFNQGGERILFGRDSTSNRVWLCGMFEREGYYEFRFDVMRPGTGGTATDRLNFGFYIAHANNYVANMPVFALGADGKPYGQPFSEWLMRPNYNLNEGKPINNDRFFYNFQGMERPNIEYQPARFDVTVSIIDHVSTNSRVVAPDEDSGALPRYTFDRVETYRVEAWKTFPMGDYITGREPMRIRTFDMHRYDLDVFGVQAQYWEYAQNSSNGEFKPFANRILELDSDISGRVPAGISLNDLTELIDEENKSGNLRPVVTNQAPVMLRINGDWAFDDSNRTQPSTKVAYRRDPWHPWQFTNPYGLDRCNNPLNPRRPFADCLVDCTTCTRRFTEFAIGTPFQTPGEYAIIVSYEYYPAANSRDPYTQVLHFRISDAAADVLLKVTRPGEKKPVTIPFSQLTGQDLGASAVEVIFNSPGGDNVLGPFEAPPRIDVLYCPNFTTTFMPSHVIPDFKQTGQAIPGWFGNDGRYVFRVFFGNNPFDDPWHVPVIEFNVIVDNSPIESFKAFQGGERSLLADENDDDAVEIFSLFGPGEGVVVTWRDKASRVDMITAEIYFYEFQLIDDEDFDYLEDVPGDGVVPSQYKILPADAEPTSMRVVRRGADEVGAWDWRLADTLNGNGIYVIRVLDGAGIFSQHVVMIDRTRAAFTQDPPIDPEDVNVQNKPTTVGFGREKLIQGGSALEGFRNLVEDESLVKPMDLSQLGDMFSDSRGIKISLTSSVVNWEKDDGQRGELDLAEKVNHQVTNEAFYWFTLTDFTRNVSSHYVEINFDMTRGFVFEDQARHSSLVDVLDGDDLNPAFDSVTRLRDGMISNREILTFRFDQVAAAPEGTDEVKNSWRVDEINVAFYALTFDTHNPDGDVNGNYPFSSVSEPVAGEISGFKRTIVYDLGFVRFEADDERVDSVPWRCELRINRFGGMPATTRPGLYVISRVCENANVESDVLPDADIKHYYFIVDNTPIISYERRDGMSFDTGINIQFGSRFAEHKDFQKGELGSGDCNAEMDPAHDRVLRTNAEPIIRMPGTNDPRADGTKFGGLRNTERNDAFEILNWDTGLPVISDPLEFNSLTLKKEIFYRAPCKEGPRRSDGTLCHECNCPSCVEPVAPNICDGFCNCAFVEVGGFDEPGMYRIRFTDGSGSRGSHPWNPSASAPPVPRGNQSEILVEVVGQGPEGVFELNGRRVVRSSSVGTESDGNPVWRHSTRYVRDIVLHPNGEINEQESQVDSLVFRYTAQDTTHFLAPIGVPGEVSEPIVRLNGNQIPFEFILDGVSSNPRRCTIILPLVNANDGDVFRVTLDNGPGVDDGIRHFEIKLDNTPPRFNLNKIQERDAFFNDNQDDIDALRYPYKLERDFVFEKADGIYQFDTFRISYFAVDSRLNNISGERFFEYGDSGSKSFFNIVKDAGLMTDSCSRFFRIRERDEAGNRTEYFVQLRGSTYKDDLRVSGLVKPVAGKPVSDTEDGSLICSLKNNAGILRGNEVSVRYVRDFFAANLFFELSAYVGGTKVGEVRRLGLDVMYIDGTPTVSGSGQAERFAGAVQRMVEAGRGAENGGVGDGGVVTFKFNNRFDDEYSWDLRQVTRNTPMFRIDGIGPADTTEFGVIDSNLHGIGLGGVNYFFQVYSALVVASDRLVDTFTGFERRVLIPSKDYDFLIVVTDEFGREARFAHNARFDSRFNIRHNGELLQHIVNNPLNRPDGAFDGVGRLDGELYFGGEIVVEFSHHAWDLEILADDEVVFRMSQHLRGGDDTHGTLLNENFAGLISVLERCQVTSMSTIRMLPQEGKTIGWEIRASRRGVATTLNPALWTLSGSSVPPKFFLYGDVPPLQFSNQSGIDMTAQVKNPPNNTIAEFSGIVTMTYSMDGRLFNAGNSASVNFTRNGMGPFGINPLITRHNFTQEGLYVLTVVNELGFAGTVYTFRIGDLSNRHYSVSFDYSGFEDDGEVEVLKASPVQYKFGDLYIQNYFVRGDEDSLIESIRTTSVDRPLIIEPTDNSNREIRGRNGNAYYHLDTEARTVIYRLFSPATETEEFIAVTRVPVTSVLVGSTPGDSSLLSVSADALFMLPDRTDNRHVTLVKDSQSQYNANAKISVGLNLTQPLIDLRSANGNVLYVDYFQVQYTSNGDEVLEQMGTLEMMPNVFAVEQPRLAIYASDYGVFAFRVRDQAGNVHKFGLGSAEDASHFTLVNLAKAPLYIRSGNENAAPIINGMVYNDVTLTVLDLPVGIAEDTFATRLEIFNNNILVGPARVARNKAEAEQQLRSISLAATYGPGDYRIVLSYQWTPAEAEVPININSREFNFTVVRADVARQSFSFIVPRDTEIISIRQGAVGPTPPRSEVIGLFGGAPLNRVTLNAATATHGDYIIRLRLGADNLQQEMREREFRVRIGPMPRNVGLVANVGDGGSELAFGGSTSGNVRISISPRELHAAYGNSQIFIIHDIPETDGANRRTGNIGVVLVNMTIGRGQEIGEHYEDFQFDEVLSESGNYRIYIAASSAKVEMVNGRLTVVGDVFVSQGFRITGSGATPVAIIVIIIVVVIVGVLVAIFVRLRTRMRVK